MCILSLFLDILFKVYTLSKMDSGKRASNSASSSSKKQRKAITLKTKLEVLKRFDAGEKAIEISRSLGLPATTVRTIRLNSDKIRASAVSGSSTSSSMITKSRPPIMDKMERLLMTWIEDLNMRSIPVNTAIIQTKAQSLFDKLRSPEENFTFTASRGWFDRFRKRSQLHNIKLTGEIASADHESAKSFPATLKSIIDEGGYSAKQVFNVDETGLYWKRLPSKTFISKQETTTPGFKIAKDRFTLLLGGNASGDFKLKPMLVYHSENPRALKNIQKSSLPVIWKFNKKAWVTSAIFTDWFKNHFCPEVKEYCSKNNISHKALLIFDNAPGHPASLTEISENVKIVFLPPNTTSLLQPMDQGAIATFKAYYLRRTLRYIISELDAPCDDERNICIKNIWRKYDILKAVENVNLSWKEVTPSTLTKVWRKLWPECVVSEVEIDDEFEQLKMEILDIARNVGFTDLNHDDIIEVMEPREEPMSNEELIQILEHTDETMPGNVTEGEPNTPDTCPLTTRKLSQFFHHIDKALEILDNDPEKERSQTVSFAISNSISCYRELYNVKKKQASQKTLDSFFKPTTSRGENEDSPPGNPSLSPGLLTISSSDED